MKLLYILCTLSIIFATNVCAQNSSNKDESVTMQLKSLLEKVEQLKAIQTSESDRYLYNCYEQLAELYESLGHYGSACIQCKSMLDLLDKYWEGWGHKSPWSYGANRGEHKMILFERYVDNLYHTKQYEKIIKYCDEILVDSRFLRLEKNYIDYVKDTREYFSERYLEANNTNPEINEVINELSKDFNVNNIDRVDNSLALSLYKSNYFTDIVYEKLAKEIYYYGQEFKELYSYLLKERAYNQIMSIYNAYTQNRVIHGGDFLFAEDIKSGKCTLYEYEVNGERGLWHQAGGNKSIWLLYYYTALSYFNLKDYDNAIKLQKRVIDNVRTDWHLGFGSTREKILEQYSKSNWVIDYIGTEVYMYEQLAYIYLCSERYEDAYKTYRYALDLNLRILQLS